MKVGPSIGVQICKGSREHTFIQSSTGSSYRFMYGAPSRFNVIARLVCKRDQFLLDDCNPCSNASVKPGKEYPFLTNFDFLGPIQKSTEPL